MSQYRENHYDIKIEAIQKELDEFKEDTKEKLKQIHDEKKEERKFNLETMSIMRDNITALQENSVRLTTLMEKIEERSEDMKEMMYRQEDRLDLRLQNIDDEVKNIREKIEVVKQRPKFIQFIMDNYKWTIVGLGMIVIIVLVLMGVPFHEIIKDISSFFATKNNQ